MALKVIGQMSDILKHYKKRSFIGLFCRLYHIVDEYFPQARKAKRGGKLNLKLMVPNRMRFFKTEEFPHWVSYRRYCYDRGVLVDVQLTYESIENRRRMSDEWGWSPIWDNGGWQNR